jgi:hypothetical protein
MAQEDRFRSIRIKDALQVGGDFTVAGNFAFGDASTDSLTVTGLFSQTYSGVADGHKVIGSGNLTANVDLARFSTTGDISSTSNVVAIEQTTGTGTAGAYGLYINCTGTNVEALKVDAGQVVFDEELTMTTTARLQFNDTATYIYSSGANVLAITGPTTTITGVTKINLDGPVDVSGALVLDASATIGLLISGATTTGIDITGACTRGIRVGTHDWGAAATGLILSTTDPLFQVAGRIVASNVTAGVYCPAYKQLALKCTTQNTDTSWFADWNELYITGGTLTGSSHYAAVKGHVEAAGTIVSSTGVTASLWGSNIIPTGYTNNGTIAGCYVDGIIHTSMTNNGDTMAYGIGAHNDPNQGDWEYAFYCPVNTAVKGIEMNNTTGIGIKSTTSALTAGDTLSGLRVQVTAAAANNAYGVAGYLEANITGTVGGTFVYGLGSWINASSTFSAAGRYICAQDNGLWVDTASATLTAAKMIFGLRMECLIGSPNAGIIGGEFVFPFSLNTQNNGITALFECMTATDLGQITNAGSDAGTLVPLFRDSGGNMRYVKLYTTL